MSSAVAPRSWKTRLVVAMPEMPDAVLDAFLEPLLEFYDAHELAIREHERSRLAQALLDDADRYTKGGYQDGIREAARALLDEAFSPFDPDADDWLLDGC